MTTANKLLTRAEIAEQLGVSLSKAGQLMKEMAQVALGGANGHKRVPQWALDAWIQEHTIHPDAPKTARPRKKAVTVSAGYDPRYFEPDGRLKRRRA